MNLTVANSPYRVDQYSAPRVPAGDNQPPAPIDPSIDKWFFISVYPCYSFLIVGICTLRIVWDVCLAGDVIVQKRTFYISTLGRIHCLFHKYQITVSLVNLFPSMFPVAGLFFTMVALGQ